MSPFAPAESATHPLGDAIFTDDPLANGTIVQKAHIADLRRAVNAVRMLAGLGAGNFTDPTITVMVTVIQAAHVTELRTNLD